MPPRATASPRRKLYVFRRPAKGATNTIRQADVRPMSGRLLPTPPRGKLSFTMAAPCILVVDDDPDIHVLLEAILKEAGFSMESASSGQEALERLQSKSYDVV